MDIKTFDSLKHCTMTELLQAREYLTRVFKNSRYPAIMQECIDRVRYIDYRIELSH